MEKKMNTIQCRLAIGLGIMIAGSGSLLAAEFDAQAVEAKLRSIAPGAGSIALSDTPIEGLLQAQVNNDIVYVSSDGDYLFQGTMSDIATRTNLTDQAKSVIRMDVV
jgi:thiol:disulfide interchange protein DsbC